VISENCARGKFAETQGGRTDLTQTVQMTLREFDCLSVVTDAGLNIIRAVSIADAMQPVISK
jgi:hypothetical protein